MKKLIKTAFIMTIPVLCGYLSVGIAFGLLFRRAGYGAAWAAASSLFVYAGSMQFVILGLLKAGAGPFSAALMTLAVNSRHMFYGLSFIERFRRMGRRRAYMIFSLTDETYSILCSAKAPAGVDEDRLFFTISVLNQLYWLTGSVLGSVLGEFIRIDITGVDFAMTALFVVIFTEQWLTAQSRLPAVIGLLSALFSMVVFGPERFLLPALAVSVAFLLVFEDRIRAPGREAEKP